MRLKWKILHNKTLEMTGKKISAFIKIDQSLTNIQQLWCALPNNLHVTNCVCQLKACVLLFVCSDVYGLVLVLACGNCLMCRLLYLFRETLCTSVSKHCCDSWNTEFVFHDILCESVACAFRCNCLSRFIYIYLLEVITFAKEVMFSICMISRLLT